MEVIKIKAVIKIELIMINSRLNYNHANKHTPNHHPNSTPLSFSFFQVKIRFFQRRPIQSHRCRRALVRVVAVARKQVTGARSSTCHSKSSAPLLFGCARERVESAREKRRGTRARLPHTSSSTAAGMKTA